MKKHPALRASVVRDALAVCGGLYRMNATYADRYGYTVHQNGKEVGTGMFLSPSDTEAEWEGIIDLETNAARLPKA